ncbi:hypothetical protein [Parabacteroides sp.]|jgi:hypothetical protein|uniref:hypothetical protein n=1 Tax=Parabacteroides sp. TaxID=1869337 RepID=UPI0030801353
MAIIIDYMSRIELSNLKELIKRQFQTDQKLMQRITFREIEYKITLSIEKKELTFKWKCKKEEKQAKVKLHTEPSNLGNGVVWYFLCPYTGHKCRKLFLDGNVIASRYAFSHVYSQSNESRSGRFFTGFALKSPKRKYGKEFYKGKLTPYGKRMAKHYKKLKLLNDRVSTYLPPHPKGRNPKNETNI